MAKCVWGDAYIATMLDLNIPSLLSQGNFGGLRRANVEHHIYTTPVDREKIEAHPAYRRLSAEVACKIVVPNVEDVVASAAGCDDCSDECLSSADHP